MHLTELLGRQDGLLTRAQALEHLSPAALRHRVRPGGPWTVLLPAIYLATTGVPTPRQRLRAGLLYGGPDAVLAGATVVQEYGLPTDGPDSRVHVLVPHDRRPASHRLVVVRRSTRPLGTALHHGLPVSGLARAVVDAARPLHQERAVRALVAASVQRRLLTVPQLEEELAASESAGSALVRRVLGEVGAGARSAPEAELMTLFRRSSLLGTPHWNCTLLHHGRWLADPDAYFEDAGLVVESDSKAWHLSPESWAETLARHGRMEATGLHVLHIVPDRHRADPEGTLLEVEAAYLAALRHGPPPAVTVKPGSAAAHRAA